MLKENNLKESLKGIFPGEVKVYDIDRFFQQQGVLVDVHAGRFSGKATLNPKIYGVDISKDEQLSNFRKEYIKGEKISFIPASIEKKFNSIETATRMKKKELAIGFEDKYMPIEVYKEFNEYLKKQQSKYADVKEEVLSQWDILMKSFKDSLDEMLNKLQSVDKDEIRSNVLAKAPTKESFEESCKLEVDVLAFPTSQNLALLDEDLSEEIKESLEKKSLNTVYEILGNILADGFESINNAMQLYQDNNCFKKPTLDSLDRLKVRMSKRNILKHPVVNNIIKNLESIKKCEEDDDEILQLLEDSSVLIYSFAKSIEVDVYIDLTKSVLAEKTLQDLSLGLKF